MASENTNLTNAFGLAKRYDYANAETEFNLLLSSNQNDVLSLYDRGCTGIHLNKYQLAIVDFDAAILSLNLSTKHELQALYQRGFAHQKLHQYNFALDSCIQCLNRAIVGYSIVHVIMKALEIFCEKILTISIMWQLDLSEIQELRNCKYFAIYK
ncbi:unnamed protein product [Rotaria socialis]|uniref:Uncharacterized protein n=1 Tax=Rotaria socialis TaxID=392032 RepID=A0A817UM17_9BILA|nr:unnamed protein product [Rotaria socialis]CAF3332205.1 unnamed protein product [Rotaria socialis]CAF3397973.1 unnamed protein product [Rotaria socialis]CAF3602683.1 unnamed protein product [Rotaria socialis]CAF4362562.1 unnamed protein product [Rotaria socialis]